MTMESWSRGAAAQLLCLLVFSAPGHAQHSLPEVSGRCASLAGLSLSRREIGLPTSGAIVSEARISRLPTDPDSLCVVRGSIAPVNKNSSPIHFQVNLPLAWNGKAVQMGGGGYNGFLVDARNHPFLPETEDPVRRGYVSFGSDSGHRSGDGTVATAAGVASFAMDAEALENFAYAQIKKSHDTVVAIIKRYYGTAPRRMYFYGNSQGGHEALLAAQRFPEDYDGVVAIHPAYNFVALQLGGLAVSKSLYRTRDSWLSPASLAMLGVAVLQTCDILDGLADGVIANLRKCRKAFKPEQLACEPGKHLSESCLSPAQVMAVKEIAAPARLDLDIDGSALFGGWPILEGAFTHPTPFGFGNKATPEAPPGRDDAFVFVMADQGIRYLVMQDPAVHTLSFDAGDNKASILRAAKLIDVTSADFDAFRSRGGKLLLAHGTVDMAIPPANSIALYERLSRRYGREIDAFTRFYLVHGFGHGDGSFQMQWNSLSALDAWVETGKSPRGQVVRDRVGPHAGRTLPLCRYPQWPRYMGHGDVASSSSFRCVSD